MTEISQEKITKLNEEYDSKPINKIVENALSLNEIKRTIKINSSKVNTHQNFEIEIPTMSSTNQQSSGRCWIFAGLNVLREIVAKKCNISQFELSQNFVAFYDKFEKINYTLEIIIELCDKDYDDRTLSFILSQGIQDGGQWDMFANIIKKYGIVPKSVMDETFQSSHTGSVNYIINTVLRKFAAKSSKLIKENKKEEILKEKEEILNKLYKLLCMSFGKPIENFDFEYTDNDRKYHIEKNLTPKTFYEKYLGNFIDDYISIINAPTPDKKFYELFTVKYIGNVVGGQIIRYVNLPMNEFKDLCVKQLKNNELIWFGSDCGKFRDDDEGNFDDKKYDYKGVFDIDMKVDKGDMLNYRISAMDHAMVITGITFKDDKPFKWKIENSWGADKINGGYYLMTDTWFDDFVYQAVINKKYLSKEQLDVINKQPVVLQPWDPMGTLAD